MGEDVQKTRRRPEEVLPAWEHVVSRAHQRPAEWAWAEQLLPKQRCPGEKPFSTSSKLLTKKYVNSFTSLHWSNHQIFLNSQTNKQYNSPTLVLPTYFQTLPWKVALAPQFELKKPSNKTPWFQLLLLLVHRCFGSWTYSGEVWGSSQVTFVWVMPAFSVL